MIYCAMPLMLVDLDNTLVDRDAAFRAAVAALVAEHGLAETDLAWIMRPRCADRPAPVGG